MTTRQPKVHTQLGQAAVQMSLKFLWSKEHLVHFGGGATDPSFWKGRPNRNPR